MVLSMKGKGEDFASLNPDQLRYLGKDEVNQYVVYTYDMQRLPDNPGQVNLYSSLIKTFFITVSGRGCNSHGKEPLDHPPDNLCPHRPPEHDQLLHKLLQTILF